MNTQNSRQQRRQGRLQDQLDSLRRENANLRLEVTGLRGELIETTRRVDVIWEAYNRLQAEQSASPVNCPPPGPPEPIVTAPSVATPRRANLLEFSPAPQDPDDLLLETGVEGLMDSSF